MSSAAKTAGGHEARPVAGFGDGVGYVVGSGNPPKAVHGAPRAAGEARARDQLRLALAKRDLLVGDLATAERAVQAADQKRWDRQEQAEWLERVERGDAPDGRAEEADLVAAIMEDRPMPAAEARPNAEAVDKLRREAESLQGAANKLKARLPERREAIGLSELAVRSAVKAVVGSSAAVAKLIDETEVLSLQLIRRRAILAAVLDFLPSDSVELARASALLQPSVFPGRHPVAESWRAAIEALARNADAPLPVMGEEG